MSPLLKETHSHFLIWQDILRTLQPRKTHFPLREAVYFQASHLSHFQALLSAFQARQAYPLCAHIHCHLHGNSLLGY